MTMYSEPSWTPMSWIGITFGWSTAAAIWASRRKRSRNASSDPSWGASTFSATHIPSLE